jgi:hypothetical protein
MALAVTIVAVLAVLGAAGYLGVAGLCVVPAGTVGIVYKRFGRRRPDDDVKVSLYGAAGPQARTLRPSTYWRMPHLYRIRLVPQSFVPSGTVGLVVAKAGATRPVGQLLGRYVECASFSDGERFLRGGGEQGPQQQVLPSGYHDINTDLFDVITTATPERAAHEHLRPQDLREVEIPIGEAGVVITHVGANAEPESVGRPVPGHDNYSQPWVFLANGGQKGVQEETLAEGGRYALNPWFAHVVHIPTRILVLEWTKERKSESNLDVSLDQIVLDVQGHRVHLEMKQTVQIPAEAAPGLVRRFGDIGGHGHESGRAPVQQFVEKELAATVAGYFRRISARYRIQEFITRYDEVGNELASEVRQALNQTGVKAVATTLEEFECDHPEINEMRREIALQQEKVKLIEEGLNALIAERDNEQVRSDIEKLQIRLEEERRKLEHIELQLLIDQLGPDHVALERVLGKWVQAKVPTYLNTGGNGDPLGTILQNMPFIQAPEMLGAMTKEMHDRKEPPATGETPAITPPPDGG